MQLHRGSIPRREYRVRVVFFAFAIVLALAFALTPELPADMRRTAINVMHRCSQALHDLTIALVNRAR